MNSFNTCLNTFISLLLLSSITLDALADEFPYLYRSAYFKGRGDTGIALAEGEDAIFYNPAGLALSTYVYNKTVLLSPAIEFSSDTRDIIKQIALEKNDPTDTLKDHLGTPQHFALDEFSGILLKKVALGVFTHQSATVLLAKDPKLGGFESVDAHAIADFGLTFSLSECSAKKQLCAGFTGKYINRSQAAFSANATESDKVQDLQSDELAMQGTAFGGDLGFMYRDDARKIPFFLGLTVQDAGGTRFNPSEPTDLSPSERALKNIKQTVNLGVAITPGTRFSRFKLLADYRDILDEYKEATAKHVHLGGELTVLDFVGFTFGLNQGYGTVGFYADIRFLRLDTGMYSEEIGDDAGSREDRRFFIKLSMIL